MKTTKAKQAVLGFFGMLMLLGLVLFTATSANAALKTVNVFYAWDEKQLAFQNSLMDIYWDGTWEPFLHQVAGPSSNDLDFDTTHTVFVSSSLQAMVGGTPTTFNVNTEFAGLMDYAVYHTDNNPAGAPGFMATRHWSLVWCDRTGDGVFNTGGGASSDLKGGDPFAYYASNKIEDLPTIFVDQVDPAGCSTGNCQDELVTRLFVTLDKNNDGQIDQEYRVGGVITGAVRPVCFYAEALKPFEDVPTWGGNVQARISAGGGDKTVNFHPLGASNPSAVTLSAFNARSTDETLPLGNVAVPGTLVVGLLGMVSVLGVRLFKSKRS